MKNNVQQKLTVPLLGMLIFLVSSAFMNGDQGKNSKSAVGGQMTWTVRTVANNGNFSPKHVFAIWIEDANGFVKTRMAMANQRKQYLYTWKAASNYNVIDAITGSTLTSHQTHTVNWDFIDLDGNLAPDGEYTVFTEYTSAHEQGPLTSTTFTKGPDAITITPPDETYFKDMELVFTPIVSEFTMDDTVICQWGTVTFTDQSVNATSWIWDFGEGAAPATSLTQGPHTVYYTTPGSKTVSLTINGNLTETKTDIIQVGTKPTAEFDYSGDLFTLNFTNNSFDATSYLWDFGDGDTSTDENPSHTFAGVGTYTVSLQAMSDYCSDDISYEIEMPYVGIPNHSLDEAITIFPNPGNGTFSIRGMDGKQISAIEIFDFSGKQIRKIRQDNQKAWLTFSFIKEEKGIYFVKILIDQKIILKKLVVL